MRDPELIFAVIGAFTCIVVLSAVVASLILGWHARRVSRPFADEMQEGDGRGA